MRHILLFIFFLSLSGFLMGQSSAKFIYGISGHPLNQQAYLKVSVDSQLNLIKKLRMTYYRVDIQLNVNGRMQNDAKFEELAKKAHFSGIKLLPMIYLSGFSYNLGKEKAYESGFLLGKSFAGFYGGNFDYYELGNELDLETALPNRSGTSFNDYDSNKIIILSSFLKGLDKGIKVSDPGSKTIVNTGGWYHYSFLELLKNEGVNFDIVGYHWYSYMEDYADKRNVDIIQTIYNKLKLPIWFTEVNYSSQGKKVRNKDIRQLKFLNDFLEKCNSNPVVEAVFIYELLDQPNKKTDWGIATFNNNERVNLKNWALKIKN